MERELALYSGIGRPSIAPQMLLRAMLLQAFYSVRFERQLMELGRRGRRRRAGLGCLPSSPRTGIAYSSAMWRHGFW